MSLCNEICPCELYMGCPITTDLSCFQVSRRVSNGEPYIDFLPRFGEQSDFDRAAPRAKCPSFSMRSSRLGTSPPARLVPHNSPAATLRKSIEYV